MIQLETAHFSNLIGAVQRTASLTGGAVRGLPNDVVVDGLPGVQSFPSSIADAQKEFELGRPGAALERIRQLETSFSSIVSRWNSTVSSIISGAKQGRQAVPAAKLNEVRNAQTRMQTLVGPATKAFRDLLTALEHEITMEGRRRLDAGEESSPETAATASDHAVPDLPEPFSDNYQVGPQLRLQRGEDKKIRVTPPFQPGSFYLLIGVDGDRVVRIEKLQKASLAVYDFALGDHTVIDEKPLIEQLKRGIWSVAKTEQS
ncbi:hypothetical protein FYK55_24925 [Roseiconus nitratireducens]|uniref:Uncharacterized protein n=1 Tax=Roseiconus nitratireducens TaxID=2605748 RepID=A0A5M6CV90_9BACT|nr:hypothetical protein [Roseiconus nitratireducens]KAA5539167.1 hypothetical protein FYK55_24925 [Roseiconus nitratireducens]